MQPDYKPELPAAYELKFYQHVDNLRSEVQQHAEQGADEGTLLWVINQKWATARLGKSWICNAGDLHCALILRPEFKFENYYQMLIVAIISLGNSIASYVSPMTALGYKWPNDITIANHKVASLWLDYGRQEASPWLSIATSVNITASPQTDKFDSMSIHEAEGTSDLTHAELLEAYSREFIKQINNWSERGFGYIYEQWRQRLQNVDQINQLHISDELIIKINNPTINQHGDIEFQSDNSDLNDLSIQEYMEITQ